MAPKKNAPRVSDRAKQKSGGRKAGTPAPPEPTQKRTYVKQSDVPSASLEEAMRIPQALLEHYAGRPTSPLHLAKALNVDPGGSQFKVLSGASIAFGLTEGGAQASTVQITDLAKRILRPTTEGQSDAARREAVLAPRVFGEFLRNYDGHQFPRPDIAINVLEGLGVPRSKGAEVLERIEVSARKVGYLTDIKGKAYVILSLQDPTVPDAALSETPESTEPPSVTVIAPVDPVLDANLTRFSGMSSPSSMATAIADDERRKKVFITHGRNRELVAPIRKLLEYGELEPVVSVDRTTVSKPVPEKVMDDMRACGAAIIHVDADRVIQEANGDEHLVINPNVLIEIGAAMAFYGRRFILLVKDGLKLPSNLQGLFEVRYSNDALDADATIRLLDAIKDIKNYPLPTDASDD